MNQALKNELEAALNLIEEDQSKIGVLLEENREHELLEPLIDLQNAAIAFGTEIERLEGEGSQFVTELEEYCEAIYQLYEEIPSSPHDTVLLDYDHIYRLWESAKACFREEFPVKREIVFLPYKASMWDSMEEIWREKKEDKTCKVSVIPIPYYDKNNDRSIGSYHYEAKQFPEDVPILDYSEYDLKSNRPDEIYIHNPYDAYNTLTTIDPAYYSNLLKKYTDQLIYIPYYLAEEPTEVNAFWIEEMEHYIMLPGVLNADLVLVQSEIIRKLYIEVLVKNFGDEVRWFWEKRIAVRASSKIGKLLRMRNKELTIPDDWKRKIYRADGSRKKVVFYNSGVTALLRHVHAELDKIEDTFHVFQRKKEDIVLLWRPHPLSHPTIAWMGVDLLERYERMIEQYLQDDYGIYDDTSDLDRAILLSDAYYGDFSSVLHMCKAVHIPIMVQEAHIRTDQWVNSSCEQSG